MRVKSKETSKHYLYVAILSVMLLLPNICACLFANDLQQMGSRLVYSMVAVSLFLLPALVLRARAFFAIQSVLLFLALVELSHLFMYNETSSILYVHTLLMSEWNEFVDMSVTLWPAILLYIIYIATYYFLWAKKILNIYLFNKKWRILLAIAFLVFFTGLLIPHLISYNPNKRWLPLEYARAKQDDLLLRQKNVFPLNIYIALGNIISSNIIINREQNRLGDFSFGIDPKTDDDPETYVLIIGETARYGNFGINGYERNTTPYLSQIENLVSFDSIYSVANLTAVSLPFMLTRATPQTPDARYNEKSIVEAFAEAGFYTAWIANQSFGNHFLRRIAASCNYEFYEPHFIGDNTKYDMDLLSCAMPLLTDDAHPKKFIVLHSLGCHFKYNLRYPETFAQFQPALEGNFNMRLMDKFHRPLILNTYDNAILYTDFFIANTIEMLRSFGNKAVLFYVADHGENLFDDNRNMILHGTYAGSEYEYHVPVFIWTSDSYNQKYPQKVAALQTNGAKVKSTEAVFHSLLDMADIHYEKLDTTLSVWCRSLQSDSIIYGVDANWKLKVIHQCTDVRSNLLQNKTLKVKGLK
ncbi:MAG: phosphoethanolamine transferase [Prevotellaceae bacterium]|jgi:glucan phosphoethanolaminetransferase (alkaline phosphatase superfamily)|nr:phosphoethanolamine transferase [Prevotellaceae bacterium]